MSSSATRPPMHTSRRASICLRLMLVWSSSGSCVTMPSAMPLCFCVGEEEGWSRGSDRGSVSNSVVCVSWLGGVLLGSAPCLCVCEKVRGVEQRQWQRQRQQQWCE